MYDIGIRFMPLILPSIFEKTELTSFTELSGGMFTCLRLLLRFQLSRPRLERGSIWGYLGVGFGGGMLGVLSIVQKGRFIGLKSRF
jgi:hypothetical protein